MRTKMNSDGNTKQDLIYLISGDPFARSFFRTTMQLCEDDNDDELYANYDMHDLSIGVLQALWDDCQSFKHLSFQIIEDDKYFYEKGSEYAYDMAGYDFFLTTAHHGSGFWDGDWPKHGDELTKLCKRFKPFELYVGDDGIIYAFGRA